MKTLQRDRALASIQIGRTIHAGVHRSELLRAREANAATTTHCRRIGCSPYRARWWHGAKERLCHAWVREARIRRVAAGVEVRQGRQPARRSRRVLAVFVARPRRCVRAWNRHQCRRSASSDGL